ncbi:hypothetical protein KQX54_004867 [Cotesia glomerata]|uniref:RNA polymerase II elongation factor ELL N-terminal domain-containing protein n=1 Tax=Cotesia glomerata TaxID=32391 RepID=A0AAV7HWY4_COTGL|nr:hypothetical protein KQX54_004867 [Cotesia glomerata]
MAALVAGVQYGLSSQTHFYENKSLIFVKLTDSAHRAIEDFLKNRREKVKGHVEIVKGLMSFWIKLEHSLLFEARGLCHDYQ